MPVLCRCLAGALALGALLATSSAARPQAADQEVLPGVSYEQQVELTPHGPVRYTVITLPPPAASPLATVGPVLTGGTLTGPSAPLSQLEQELSTTTTAIGINGDFMSGADHHPNGIVVQSGVLLHGPNPARSSLGVGAGGGLLVGRLSFAGTWKGSGQRRPLSTINQRPGANQTILFTPAWGPTAPAVAHGAAIVLEPFPAATINTDLTATVASTSDATTPTPIPADGAVIVATGTAAAKLQAEAPQDGSVTVRLILPPAWGGVTAAVGGGPLLVRNHRPVFHTGENFDAGDLTTRTARSAVGQLPSGQLLLVVVDGGQPGYSVGMTNYELAQTLQQLGATTAVGLQYGKAATAAFDGRLLSRPAAEQPLKEALLFQYAGVYAAPPSVPVVVKESATSGEQLAYKLVRPSTVTANVIGPDGTAHPVDSGSRDPGVYPFTWNAFDAEGIWHWNVSATDDLGRASTFDETFTYDLTLSGLAVPKSASAKTGLRVGFTLSRPASVALQVETAAGTVVSSAPAADLQAGPQTLSWQAVTSAGTPVPPGPYVVRVSAKSAIGTSDLSAAFGLRR